MSCKGNNCVSFLQEFGDFVNVSSEVREKKCTDGVCKMKSKYEEFVCENGVCKKKESTDSKTYKKWISDKKNLSMLLDELQVNYPKESVVKNFDKNFREEVVKFAVNSTDYMMPVLHDSINFAISMKDNVLTTEHLKMARMLHDK